MNIQMTMKSCLLILTFLLIFFNPFESFSQQSTDRWSIGLSPIYGVTSGTIKNESFPFGFAQNSWGLDLRTQFQWRDSWGFGLGLSYQTMGYDANGVAEFLLYADSKATAVDVKSKGYNIYSFAPFLYYKWQSSKDHFLRIYTSPGVAIIQSPRMEAFVYTEPHTEYNLSRGNTSVFLYSLGIQPGYRINKNLSVVLSAQASFSSPVLKWQDDLGLEHSQHLSFRQIILGLGIEYQLCTQKNNGKF
jgi:hypothetical protein